MAYLLSHSEGTLLRLHIQPKASKTAIIGKHGDRLKIAIKSPPVDGKANAELCKFIAKSCRVPKSAVQILRGESCRQKDILIFGITPMAIAQALLPEDKKTAT
jgi:uncharacterized protein (TIGR00251 family)